MKRQAYFIGLLSLMFAIPCSATKTEAKTKLDTTLSNSLQKNKENQPLFKDGHDYLTYKTPVQVDIPKGKVLIQYFYQYGCGDCLSALDSLNLYAKNHSDKVILAISPSIAMNNSFTSAMNATLNEYGRPELSPLYLFDSVHRKKEKSLINNNDEIQAWLKQNNIDVQRFNQLFHSDLVKKHIDTDIDRFKLYHYPSYVPMAILNGKYVLLKTTLYNDDYTFGVLDFLIEKLQQEQEEKNGK